MTTPATEQQPPPTPATPPPAAPPPAAHGGTPPSPPQAPATPPAPPGADQENLPWLPQRLGRERAQVFKDLGVDNAEDAKARLTRLKDIETAQETERQRSLSELQREKERATKLEGELAAERTRATEMQTQSALSAACAQQGVRNTEYAEFLFNRARKLDPTVTPEAALKNALNDATSRAALGAAPVETTLVPPDDTAPPQGGGPKPPAGGPKPFDANSATPEEWAQHRAKLGLR